MLLFQVLCNTSDYEVKDPMDIQLTVCSPDPEKYAMHPALLCQCQSELLYCQQY